MSGYIIGVVQLAVQMARPVLAVRTGRRPSPRDNHAAALPARPSLEYSEGQDGHATESSLAAPDVCGRAGVTANDFASAAGGRQSRTSGDPPKPPISL